MKYVIVESGGKQYKAAEGSMIEVDRLPVEAGEQVVLDSVLLAVNEEQVMVGTPVVKGARVNTTVVRHLLAPKVIIFRYRAKKRIRTKKGHRQQYTALHIDSIVME